MSDHKFARRVILESPYAGDVAANIAYARQCVRDSLSRNEAPIASHLLYTQAGILRDENPDERQWGVDAGLSWGGAADATVVYTDRGISKGMEYGIENAKRLNRPIEYRTILKPPEDPRMHLTLKDVGLRTETGGPAGAMGAVFEIIGGGT